MRIFQRENWEIFGMDYAPHVKCRKIGSLKMSKMSALEIFIEKELL